MDIYVMEAKKVEFTLKKEIRNRVGKEQVLKKPPKMVKKVVNEGKLFMFRQCDCHVLSQTKCFSKAHTYREENQNQISIKFRFQEKTLQIFQEWRRRVYACNFDQTVVPDAEREHCFHKLRSLCKRAKLYFLPSKRTKRRSLGA